MTEQEVTILERIAQVGKEIKTLPHLGDSDKQFKKKAVRLINDLQMLIFARDGMGAYKRIVAGDILNMEKHVKVTEQQWGRNVPAPSLEMPKLTPEELNAEWDKISEKLEKKEVKQVPGHTPISADEFKNELKRLAGLHEGGDTGVPEVSIPAKRKYKSSARKPVFSETTNDIQPVRKKYKPRKKKPVVASTTKIKPVKRKKRQPKKK
jgi:hypothetical protein